MVPYYSGNPVIVQVGMEREDEVTGPVIAPFFAQVYFCCFLYWWHLVTNS